MGHVHVVFHGVGPAQGHRLGSLAGEGEEEVVFDGVGLECFAEFRQVGIFKFGRDSLDGKGIYAVCLEFCHEGDLTGSQGVVEHALAFFGEDFKDILLRIRSDIPLEGGLYAGIGIYLG